MASRLAARRATAGEVAQMRASLTEMGDQVTDRQAYIRADLALHATIQRATH